MGASGRLMILYEFMLI